MPTNIFKKWKFLLSFSLTDQALSKKINFGIFMFYIEI